MSERNSLLRGCVADKNNDLPKLVFCDWLEESGVQLDREFAAFIRACVQLKHRPPLPPKNHPAEMLLIWHDTVTGGYENERLGVSYVNLQEGAKRFRCWGAWIIGGGDENTTYDFLRREGPGIREVSFYGRFDKPPPGLFPPRSVSIVTRLPDFRAVRQLTREEYIPPSKEELVEREALLDTIFRFQNSGDAWRLRKTEVKLLGLPTFTCEHAYWDWKEQKWKGPQSTQQRPSPWVRGRAGDVFRVQAAPHTVPQRGSYVRQNDLGCWELCRQEDAQGVVQTVNEYGSIDVQLYQWSPPGREQS